jgi:hypothetical protein
MGCARPRTITGGGFVSRPSWMVSRGVAAAARSCHSLVPDSTMVRVAGRSQGGPLTTQAGRQSVDRIVSEADLRRGLLSAASLPIAVIRTVESHRTR